MNASGYVVLWLALTAASVVLVVDPDLPLAGPNPPLAVTVATISGAVGLALLQLRVLRFSVLGCGVDLFVGLAFGTLALANLVIRVLAPAAEAEPGRIETGVFFILFARGLASLLFLAGLARAEEIVPVQARAWYGIRLTGIVAVALLLGAAVLLLQGHLLPPALQPAVREQLEAGAIIRRPLLNQELWLLLARGCVGGLMLLAAVGYSRLALRSNDSHLAVFAVAITLLFFGQLHSIMVGPLPVDYVSTADGLRLLAYVVLLHDVVTRIASEIADRASEVERLRLSRELHDGLAQHLSLLHLSLDRLGAGQRSPQEHARDLARARRLVEAAALEADQAITALRTGVVTWDAFVEAVNTLTDEFAENHEIEVGVATHGSARVLEAELQAEVVRILHEACSNAVRHGRATRISVEIAATPEWLKVRVQDNGPGFDLPAALASGGVGIRSMTERLQRRGGSLSLDSMPGQGATVHVCLPLARQRSARR